MVNEKFLFWNSNRNLNKNPVTREGLNSGIGVLQGEMHG